MARACILQVSFGVRYKHAYLYGRLRTGYHLIQLFTDFAVVDAQLRRFRA